MVQFEAGPVKILYAAMQVDAGAGCASKHSSVQFFSPHRSLLPGITLLVTMQLIGFPRNKPTAPLYQTLGAFLGCVP